MGYFTDVRRFFFVRFERLSN